VKKHENSLPKAVSPRADKRPWDLPTKVLRIQSNGWMHNGEVMARPNVSSPSTSRIFLCSSALNSDTPVSANKLICNTDSSFDSEWWGITTWKKAAVTYFKVLSRQCYLKWRRGRHQQTVHWKKNEALGEDPSSEADGHYASQESPASHVSRRFMTMWLVGSFVSQ
jgi:hypothetical protein